jgi:uncharacterized membrane protein YqjE
VPIGDAGPSPAAGPARREGLRAAAARVGSAAVGLLATRAELLSVELAEERTRLTRLIVLLAAGGVLLAFAMMFAGTFVIALFWDTYRLAAIAAVAIVHLGIGLFLLSKARGIGSGAPAPFAATLEELHKDRAMLRQALAQREE